MVRTFLLVTIFSGLLAGCGGTVTLLADGKAHRGKFDAVAKSLDVTIDGKRYVGTYITNAATSAGGFFAGKKYISTTSSVGASEGRAILVADDQQTLRCEFAVQGMSAQGSCQDAAGKVYDMIAGQ
jgi:hypothetical protein